ncbi:MAG: A/G-specific adenine glycosylase [Cytophagales bacterium]|nr:MAG: A/G-specific adenine glycosylase [Cytophagales bacterium]
MQAEDFSFALIGWYEQHKRSLPWRNIQNPYQIWLSEIILQQTRVSQGLPYYLRFVEAFPTVADMAKAEEKDVLRLWQGLGYYSRARNMHQSSKMVMDKFGGEFPDNYKEILTLKGVGSYTAAAIASFAFNEAVAVVDGNVFRVLARIFGIEEDIASGKGQKIFQELANELLPKNQSAVYNQAIMEFGAMHCKPATPDCLTCIFKDNCFAFAHKKQNVLPIKIKKLKIKYRNFTYLVFSHQQKIMMKMRGEGDIWQGLYDFVMLEDLEGTQINEALKDKLQDTSLLAMQIGREILPKLKVRGVSQTYKHVLTHQQITAQFIYLQVDSIELAEQILAENNLALYSPTEVGELPKPILIVNYLKKL